MKAFKRTLLWALPPLAVASAILFYFFQPPGKSPLVASGTTTPYQLLPELTDGRYFIINDFPEFSKKLQENKGIARLLSSRAGKDFFFSPPFAAMGGASHVLQIFPDSFEWGMLEKLIPHDLYYTGGREGFVLIFQTPRAGSAILSRLDKKYHVAIQGSWFILASSEELLESEKENLRKPHQDMQLPYTPAGRGEAVLTIGAFEEDIQSSIFFGLYSRLFPVNTIESQSFLISPGKNGIAIEGKAYLPEGLSLKEKVPSSISKGSSSRSSSAAFYAYSPFSMGQLLDLLQDNKVSNKKSDGTSLHFSGLTSDYGLLLPVMAIEFPQSERDMADFFQQAFRYGNYRESGDENSYRINYPRYSYSSKTTYYEFSPTLEKSENNYTFYSTEEAKELTSDKKTNSLPTTKNIPLFSFSMKIDELLANSRPAIEKTYPTYFPAEYLDFREYLKKIEPQLSGAKFSGTTSIADKWIESSWQLQL